MTTLMILLTLSRTTFASETEQARNVFDNLTEEEVLFWAPIISKVTPEEYTVFIQAVQEDKAELEIIREVLEEEREYTRRIILNYEKLEKKHELLLAENIELRAQAKTWEELYHYVKPTFADKVMEKAGVAAAVFAVLWALTQ